MSDTERTFRYENLKPTDPYFVAWSKHANRSLLIFSGIALGMFLLFPFSLNGWLGFDFTGAIVLATIFGSSLNAYHLKCPRCGKRYIGIARIPRELLAFPRGPAQRTCGCCGLPRWAPSGEIAAGGRD